MAALPASAASMTCSPTEVCFVLPPALVLLDFAGAADAFRIAVERGLPARLRFAAPADRDGVAPTSLGLGVSGVEALPQDLAPGALVVICGTAGSDDGDAVRQAAAATVVDWLRRVAPGRRIASVCSGALLAARAGLLDGRRCTTHHSLLDALQRLAPGAHVLDSRVFVEDAGVYTSAGITAGIDLALHLIGELGSPRLAAEVAREMVVYLRRAPDDPALSPWLVGRNHMDARIHRVQDALARAPAEDWPLPRLAELGAMSVRSLTRHFREAAGVSVHDYHARLRLALARQALVAGDSVERAAERAGLGSARQLRRLWAVHVGGSPSHWRASEIPL